MLLADIAVWMAGYGIALYTVKSSGGRALRRLLPQSVDFDMGGVSAAGQQGMWALLTTFVFWLLLAAFSPSAPFWIAPLVGKLGR